MTTLRSVERAATRLSLASRARDEAIREARKSGATLRDLARAAGVSHEQIRRIVDDSR